jgi:hypothetical protein
MTGRRTGTGSGGGGDGVGSGGGDSYFIISQLSV